MSLQDELTQLTASQPVQPADRLTAVTGRARRIRRNRSLAAAAAALAIAVPVGAVLTSAGTETRSIDYTSTPDTWPDRTPGGDTRLAEGAISLVRRGGASAPARVSVCVAIGSSSTGRRGRRPNFYVRRVMRRPAVAGSRGPCPDPSPA